ncbi:DUF3667 domain-containing protein [Dokdonia ponticola]|uniref:DUF3667 domain-containing protein n=1 Tax=Dokdonia ponticola TaxID=2041041 RepID=A0ABV9HST2_9FLAO
MEEELLPEETVSEKPKKKKKEKKKEQLPTISDRCKNCDTPLNLDQAFCSSCGAKRMYNRLNWSNLTEDFADRFLNIENNFLRTFFALFTKPEDVIGGYIDGVRKRYLSAFSYFAISLTVTSLFTFVFRKWFLDDALLKESAKANNTPDLDAVMDVVNWIFEYQSIVTFTTIPLFALISIVVFWNYKKYNFIEHVVIYLYVYSHTQIIASVASIVFIWSDVLQVMVSFVLSFLYVGYTAYVLMRLFDLTIKKIVLKTLLFLVVSGVIGTIFFGLSSFILFKIGAFDTFIEKLEALKESQKAVKEAAKAAKDSIRMDSIRQLTKSVKDTLLLFGS